jgi:hypothetical protein
LLDPWNNRSPGRFLNRGTGSGVTIKEAEAVETIWSYGFVRPSGDREKDSGVPAPLGNVGAEAVNELNMAGVMFLG